MDVRNGIVVLSGAVEDRRQKRAAEDALDDVQGIRDVENRLRVRSGPGDDGMRDDDRARRAAASHGGGAAAGGIFAPRNDRLYRTDLRGFEVEAPDGGIGKVDDRTEPGSDVLVVDTGPWIFGRHVLLPLGLVDRVDLDTQTVFVDRTKDEIKDAPEYSPDRGVDDDLRHRVGEYYSSRQHGRESYQPEEYLRR